MGNFGLCLFLTSIPVIVNFLRNFSSPSDSFCYWDVTYRRFFLSFRQISGDDLHSSSVLRQGVSIDMKVYFYHSDFLFLLDTLGGMSLLKFIWLVGFCIDAHEGKDFGGRVYIIDIHCN